METKNTDKALKDSAIRIVKATRIALASVGTDSGSDLSKSVKFKLSGNVVVIDMAYYGEFLDQGRKPGKAPPISSLNQWAAKRGLNAFAVQKNIEKFGTKAHPFIFKLDKIEKEIDKTITDGIFKDAELTTDEMILKNKNAKII